MKYQEIPAGSVEVQTGLWAFLRKYTVGGQPRERYLLYSAEGYCFYEIGQPENYVDGDTSGELLPPEQRVYATYMSTAYTTLEQINSNIVSVVHQGGYENV